jgi:broad specificity phosphatase PhoE
MSDAGANEYVPTRVVLVRHAESMASVDGVIGGPRTCVGLSPFGRRQAVALRDRLATTSEISADALYASTYPRAIETAEIIAPALGGLDVKVDDGFGEHDPGPDCDGLTYDAFLERHGFPDWENDPHGVSFPGGETVAEFHHRVGVALRAAVERHSGQTLVVVCHGGVVDAAVRIALRTPSTGGFEVRTKNTSITEIVLVRPGRWRLERYNDHAHLAAVETPAT